MKIITFYLILTLTVLVYGSLAIKTLSVITCRDYVSVGMFIAGSIGGCGNYV